MNVCRFCGEFFVSESSLRQHEARHRQDGPYKCDICSQVAFSENHYKTDMQRHSSERKYECKCGKSFKTSHDLKRHEQRTSQTKEFKCDECGLA
jgi:KRAB domain-containing zinc finger protein